MTPGIFSQSYTYIAYVCIQTPPLYHTKLLDMLSVQLYPVRTRVGLALALHAHSSMKADQVTEPQPTIPHSQPAHGVLPSHEWN